MKIFFSYYSFAWAKPFLDKSKLTTYWSFYPQELLTRFTREQRVLIYFYQTTDKTLPSLRGDSVFDSAPSKVICCGVCLIWKHESIISIFARAQARYAWWTESISSILVLFFVHCGQTWWMFNIHYLIIHELLITFGSAFTAHFFAVYLIIFCFVWKN